MSGDTHYIPLDIRTFSADLPPVCDLYIREGRQHVLYRGSSLPFTMEDRQGLLNRGINRLWIRVPLKQGLSSDEELPALLSLPDEELPSLVKTKLLYDSAKVAVVQSVNQAFSQEILTKVKDLISACIVYLSNGKYALSTMLSMMTHDFSVYTHSVNVAIYALGLAKFVGITEEEELLNLGIGAMLHDVGKVNIPKEVLDKNGPLSAEEWGIVKQHPIWGVELLSEADLPEIVLTIVVQHHERLDGQGYPNGISGNELNRYSKIIALVDTFEALTSVRPHRAAVPPFSALSTMMKEMTEKLDRDLFISMICFLGNHPQYLTVAKTMSQSAQPGIRAR